MSSPAPEGDVTPPTPPAADPPAAPDPLQQLVEKLASFDPVDFENRLKELGDKLTIPDVGEALRTALQPIAEQLDAVTKELKKLGKPAAPPAADPPAPPTVDPTDAPTPEPPPAPPSGQMGAGGQSLRDTLFGIPKVG